MFMTPAATMRTCVRNESHLRTAELLRLIGAVQDLVVTQFPDRLPEQFSLLYVRSGPGAWPVHPPCWERIGGLAEADGGWMAFSEGRGGDVFLARPAADTRWEPGRLLPLAEHRDLIGALGQIFLWRGEGPMRDRAEVVAWCARHGITPRRFPIRVGARRAQAPEAAQVRRDRLPWDGLRARARTVARQSPEAARLLRRAARAAGASPEARARVEALRAALERLGEAVQGIHCAHAYRAASPRQDDEEEFDDEAYVDDYGEHDDALAAAAAARGGAPPS